MTSLSILNFVSHISCYVSENTRQATQPHSSRVKMNLPLVIRQCRTLRVLEQTIYKPVYLKNALQLLGEP